MQLTENMISDLQEEVISSERASCTYRGSLTGGLFRAEGRACHAYLYSGTKAQIEINWLAVPRFCRFATEGVEAQPSINYNSSHPKNVLAILKSNKANDIEKATYAFHKWLLNDSFFGEAFITKDVDKALVEGAVINLDCQQQVAMCALIASRRPHEYPLKVLAWHRLVKLGVHPRVAHVFSEGFRSCGDNEYYFKAYLDGHEAFDLNNMTLDSVRRIKNGVLYDHVDKYDIIRCGYESVTDAFCPQKHPAAAYGLNAIVGRLWKLKVPEEVVEIAAWGGGTEKITTQYVHSIHEWVAYVYDIIQELDL